MDVYKPCKHIKHMLPGCTIHHTRTLHPLQEAHLCPPCWTLGIQWSSAECSHCSDSSPHSPSRYWPHSNRSWTSSDSSTDASTVPGDTTGCADGQTYAQMDTQTQRDKGMERPMYGQRNEHTDADFWLGKPASGLTSLMATDVTSHSILLGPLFT